MALQRWRAKRRPTAGKQKDDAIGNSRTFAIDQNRIRRLAKAGLQSSKVPHAITWLLMKTIIPSVPLKLKCSRRLEDALRALQLADRADPLSNTIAKRIIDLAHLGERDPVRLREYALEINHRD
jgi:hypothetical protein